MKINNLILNQKDYNLKIKELVNNYKNLNCKILVKRILNKIKLVKWKKNYTD